MKGQRFGTGLLVSFTLLVAAATARGQPNDFPPPVNTQNPKDIPPSPREALGKITVPPGFRVTLFAAEPDVRQPIGFTTDARGRLWVAENYTYAENRVNFDLRQRDRIVILEDTDGDGVFDRRKVFWDRGQRLTSVAVGFGGVWALCAPHLLFLPDRDGDDVPDGEPEVVLDGWDANAVRHNIVNGLLWGPDGWLYGRHGILATSAVGRPGTPPNERVRLNCGIWRYHPTRKIFEGVAHGTTNPWGLDYDDHGQMFFTNTVIGHLWHLVPGAHYRRMYGEDLHRRTYGLLEQTADHFHWDTGEAWSDVRKGVSATTAAKGGGHAHCGGMIYLGANWPDRYHNTLFTVNLHGHRLNNDRLERRGSGYVARHADDLFFANDEWFRGIELLYGPDGGVFVADWTDTGECHENDGVHRTSGRIYKVTYGRTERNGETDLTALSDRELVRLQLHRNDWYVRQARRLLQERAAAGRDLTAARADLFALYERQADVTRRLRALWCLHVTGGLDETWLLRQLEQPDEHLRTWAVRLLVDHGPPSATARARLVRQAAVETSGLVRLFLASALQRLPAAERRDLAAALLRHAEDAADPTIPLMLWYGVEPIADVDPAGVVELAGNSRIPLVRQYIARRLTEDLDRRPEFINALVKRAADDHDTALAADVLRGMSAALGGWRKAKPPAAWPELRRRLADHREPGVREPLRSLNVVFGDGRAVDELRRTALDANADADARRAALRVLIDNRPDGTLGVLQKLVADRATMGLAVRGLAAFDDPTTPQRILNVYGQLAGDDRATAVSTLASRPAYARALLQAVADGKIPRSDISAYQARQIRSLGDAALSRRLAEVWGEVRSTPDDKKRVIARYRQLLTPEQLKTADPGQGRLLFNQHCATCHTLYGQGKQIGPDLTGSDRGNLDYLLENLVDPSAIVAAEFRMAVVTLKNGRVLNGVVGEKTERTVTVQTQQERVQLERAEIEGIEPTTLSLMPEGQLSTLSDQQAADLIAYLISREQVPLPK